MSRKQVAHILRLCKQYDREGKRPAHKEISKIVGCSPYQSQYAWKKAKRLHKQRARKRLEKKLSVLLIAAKRALEKEIAESKAESATAKPYKDGVLKW